MKISIIGDSSSSTIGGSTNIYPEILYNKITKEKNCEIVNYSVPGVTSSDAKSIYFSQIKESNNDVLIIYLGNNESVYGPHKGYCSNLFWNIRKFFYKKENYNELFFLKDKFKFSYKFSNFSISNLNSEFKKNVESIVRDSEKKNLVTILINPVANRQFYSGAGAKNFEFFKLINIDDKVSNLLTGSDEQSSFLIKAINFQEKKLYKESTQVYEKIIKENNNILSFISKNNLAVIFSAENTECSKQMFKNLLNTYKEYDPIIYYNLYLLEKGRDSTSAEKYLNLSYSKDFSLYRIQKDYRNSLEEIKNEFKIDYLDLKNILNENDFIDYCHPTKEAHKKIADNIVDLICKNSQLLKNSRKNYYINKLVSPDYFNNPRKNFVDYYLIEKNISKSTIKNNLFYLLNKYQFNNFSKKLLISKYIKDKNKCYIINFIKSNAVHPIFTKNLLDNEIYLPLKNEIFSLPENYIYRIMFNYINFFDKNFKNKILHEKKLKLNKEFYEKIILRNSLNSLHLPLLFEKKYQQEIKKNMSLYIKNESKIFENHIQNRLKTIIFWYTRESFRYGTLSRSSMLYNKFAIDRLIETLIVLICIELNNNGEDKDIYSKMLQLVYSLLDVHETHVNKYLNKENFNNLEYEKDLNDSKKNFILLMDKLK